MVGACAIFMGACGNAGEGDYCEVDNGNDDCQNGLTCQPAGTGAICCPQDPALATTPGCSKSATAGQDASGIPAEASAVDVSVNDSASSVDTGAPQDSGSDVVDANDDGG